METDGKQQTGAGKVVLVTGAAEGIGKATALLFGQRGWQVACLGLKKELLEEVADTIANAGSRSMAIEADITDFRAVTDAVERVREAWGGIDCLVANAGINGVWAVVEDLEIDEFDTTINVNLGGTFRTIKAAMPSLKERSGSVVITASILGANTYSMIGASAYASSKAGLVALTKMLALEVAESGVRVNSIAPGSTRTSIGQSSQYRSGWGIRKQLGIHGAPIPLTGERLADPVESAESIYFLASDKARHITGMNLQVDGGQSLILG